MPRTSECCTRNNITLAQRREGPTPAGHMPSPCIYGPRHGTSGTPSLKKATTSSPGSKAPHRRKMGWMLPEDGLVERVSASPTRRRRLSLSRTSSLHTSNTGGGSFTLDAFILDWLRRALGC
uniref:Uncharacterized protein n=1 Tax=Aegilops tauschii subsp. strangulata TaxID=200361 RepID=A0A453RDZ6_AEGTS